MGFAAIGVRAHGWDDRLAMTSKVQKALRGRVAEAIGVYMVAQVAYTHEVQGRDEDDKHGVWPPRKTASTGLIVFGDRSAVKRAINEALNDPTKQQFEIARSKKAPSGVASTFGRKQVLGAALALEQEALRVAGQKAAGIGGARAQQEARRSAWKTFKLASAEGNVEAALEARKLWRMVHRKITGAGSYARTASYLPRPVLLRTGTLRDSWTFRVESEGSRVIVYIGTQVPYARFHELGTATLPARREVVVSAMDRKHIKDIATEILNEELNHG